MARAGKGLPKGIRVGPHRYTVTCDATAIAKASHQNGSALNGLTDRQAHTITLDPALARSALADTVVHESLHCLLALVGSDHELGDEEERLVRKLAPALLDWLRRNPKLIRWLEEDCDG